MEKSDDTTIALIGGIAIGLLALLIAVLINGRNGDPRLVNDVAQAMVAARCLEAGDGYATDALYYPENYAGNKIPAPQTVFPPGLPFAMVFLKWFSVEPIQAAFLLALVSFVLIPILLYVLCMRCGTTTSIALTTGLLWLGVVTAWENVFDRKTDVTFLMFTLVSTLFLVRPVRRPILMACLAGCLAAMAMLMRYAGLFFLIAAALTILVEWIRHRTRTKFAELVAFCLPSGGTLVALFARNYQVAGSVKGGNSYRLQKPWIESARDFYRSISELTGFSHKELFDWNPAEFVIAIAVMAGIGMIWKYRREINLRPPAFGVAVDRRVPVLCLIYPVLTVAILVWLELTTCVGLRARLFMVVVPFCMLLAGIILRCFSCGRVASGPLRFVGMLLVTGFLLGQVEAAKRVFRDRPNWGLLQTAGDSPLEDSTLKEFLQRHISRKHPLLVNEPQLMGALLERPVIGLAEAQYTPQRWDVGTVRQHICPYDVEWVLLLTDRAIASSDTVPFFDDLQSGRQPGWLKLQHASNAFRLYRVVPESLQIPCDR